MNTKILKGGIQGVSIERIKMCDEVYLREYRDVYCSQNEVALVQVDYGGGNEWKKLQCLYSSVTRMCSVQIKYGVQHG